MTQVIVGRPPNYHEILRQFPKACAPNVIFAYAPVIYASHVDLPEQLIVHESVHIERQLDTGVENWWTRYLDLASFRYAEELLAHRAELQWLQSRGNRDLRRFALKHVAAKLCDLLYQYGTVINMARAMKDLSS